MKRKNKINWTGCIQALVLVKIGQDLGTHTPAAQSLHDIIEALVAFLSALVKLV